MSWYKRIILLNILVVLFLSVPLAVVAAEKINLNTATASELTQLNGIGEKTAEKIVAYRKNHPFKTVEELTNVNGVGDKTLNKIKDQVTVDSTK